MYHQLLSQVAALAASPFLATLGFQNTVNKRKIEEGNVNIETCILMRFPSSLISRRENKKERDRIGIQVHLLSLKVKRKGQNVQKTVKKIKPSTLSFSCS